MKIDDHGFHRIVVDPEVKNEISVACFRKVGFRPGLPRDTSLVPTATSDPSR